ncbi:antitoxin Xre/MbcA/ParS toxin-binding domain-containing protein [Sphingomonas desiccabilis]|uniref:DUF2384 domain-containing protein n=1 Tax=Sphingomonas desiccabilis TaxID=429134 RepID=A0A4Q2ITS7_9SPHN|nr:antitoxin Xre/MbcA/ParS toxin-binding domain-containing protein [Sphingomonas desiccabilis]MBB3911414.1 uncharacterized protein (DUF2384 family) [Sphingomonas desiccabilis]RXZ31811.1 DUF2384 domain-containing protein [Sphingomonas desiccabilis]
MTDKSTTPTANRSAEEPADSLQRPKRRQFVSRYKAPRLSPEEADRQGRITLMAFRMLGGRDEAIAFLNSHDPVLEGRPLDLAVGSDAGLAAVEHAIAGRATAG